MGRLHFSGGLVAAVKRPLLEILKDWSGLLVGGAALLYVFGFTVHWAYFRLLGIDINGQPLDYLRFAADYSTSVVSSAPQLLFAFPYYSPKLVNAPLLMSTILCSLIVIIAISLHLRLKTLTEARKTKPAVFVVLWWILNVMIVVSISLLLQKEFDIAKVRDVLQPVDAADIQQMQNQLSTAGSDNAALLEVRGKNVSRIYEKYTQNKKGSPGFDYFNDWFNPTIGPNNSTERRAVYLALLLLNLVLLFAIIFQLRSLRNADEEQDKVSFRKRVGFNWSRTLILLFSAGLLMQMFLFPFVYATLGRNLSFPIVMLKFAKPSEGQNAEVQSKDSKPEGNAIEKATVHPDGEIWTHCVYLIVDLDNEIVVYDRLNFFQVKRVPRARILTISQVFAASPFESCSKEVETFTPCETLWMPEETPILDF
jgi:hypothetical protein